ncbi:cholinephosphotransferase 1 isoform X1 [Macrobrachium rosenbergii]|uniref:cholinephosphotransferase 1 isoform X1 n=1 Tax=Macrobrachium rosenbergii TaxID=79674 RepID=UPI0034D53193
MGQLKDFQLRRLEEHKYSCASSSLMDPMMQKWWCWLVEQCPLTLAPNLITISGLLVNIATSLLLVYYSPDAKQEVPRWACFLCALGLFLYQSLDAIDGKQARRTGTSSPLGELFDHGCDSLSTVFVSLGVACSVRLGTHPYWMFFQCMMAVTLFYCAHWQTYVSGTLRFGFIDVTEAQFGVIAIHLLSVIFGPSFWSLKIPVLFLPFKCLPTIVGIVAAAVALFNNFKIILIERGAGRNGSTVAIPGTDLEYLVLYITAGLIQVLCQFKTVSCVILFGGAGKNGSSIALPFIGFSIKYVILYCILFFQIVLAYSYMHTIPYTGAGKNGSTVAGTSVLSPVVPLLFILVPSVLIAWKSPYDIYLQNPTIYLLTFGCVSARVTNRLVVAHMTKSEMAYSDASLLGPALLFLNQYVNCPINENYLLYIVCIYVIYDLIKYCQEVCLEICHHLNISLFTIVPKRPASSTSSAAFEKNGSSKYMTRSKAKVKSN